MARLTGEDSQVLATLLDYRVGQLEEKVEDNGRCAQGVAIEVAKVSTKLDTLIDLHQTTSDRLDAHIDKGVPLGLAPPAAKGITLTPMWVLAGASAVAAWAAAAYVAGKDATARFLQWLLHFIGA